MNHQNMPGYFAFMSLQADRYLVVHWRHPSQQISFRPSPRSTKRPDGDLEQTGSRERRSGDHLRRIGRRAANVALALTSAVEFT